MNYTVVFDATTAGFRQGWSLLWFLPFVVVSAVLVFKRDWIHPPSWRILPFFFLGFVLIIAIPASLSTYNDYQKLTSALRDNRCEIVEGRVTDFDPMPVDGHKMESFVVAGRRFAYSDYDSTAGFNNAHSHGGPVDAGVYVRIHYLGNEIAKLEVAL